MRPLLGRIFLFRLQISICTFSFDSSGSGEDWSKMRRIAFLSQYLGKAYQDHVISRQMTDQMREDAERHGFFRWSSVQMAGDVTFDIVLIAVDPEVFLRDKMAAVKMIAKVMFWAHGQGYTDIGLGSLTASVSRGGDLLVSLADKLNLRLDHGDAMSTALAWSMIGDLEPTSEWLSEATIAIVGGVGIMGAGFARLIAGQVPKVILVVKDTQDVRVSRLTDEFIDSGTDVVAVSDFSALRSADLVYIAHTGRPITPVHLKPGAIVLDAGAPAGARAKDFVDTHDFLILTAGCGILPKSVAPKGVGVDLCLGEADNGCVAFGCMTGIYSAAALGVTDHQVGSIDPMYARRILIYGASRGIKPQPLMMFGRPVLEAEVALFISMSKHR